jgi:dolichyl-phosphate beta-glucosyltransferase
VLKINVYDTQCGAKVFRVSENLVRALSEPFLSRWAFDVELIGRLLNDPNAGYSEQDFIEVPLQQWNDIKGSKIGFLDMVTATFELLLIKRALNVWARVGAKFQ